MKTRNLSVIIYKEDGLYIAECPEVETVDQGATIEAAIDFDDTLGSSQH